MSGLFDVHVHGAPDITARRADDVTLLRGYAEAGFSGCVLKGHYDSTVGRAVAAGAGLDLRVYGGQALNQHVGGLNPAAVAAALRLGARVIWMPTTDARAQIGLPRLCCKGSGLAETTYAIPPVDWSLVDNVRLILALIAEADAVLATGHLSTPEVGWLLPEARAAGVCRILLTHPSFTVPAMSAARAAELTAPGGYAEITAFQLLRQPDCDGAMLADFIRTVGYRRIVLSSDVGQPDSPTPQEALWYLIETLAAQGLDRAALIACASEIPENLVAPR